MTDAQRQDSGRKMVAVCVATFRRPEGLRALLESLDVQTPPPGVSVHVVVVNNDAETPVSLPESLGFPVTSVVEPRRGIYVARNRALDAAPPEADFIVFVDDDETVRPGWLSALVEVQARSGAAAVQGAVVPVFEAPPPAWMTRSGLFELGPYEDGALASFAATNNVLIDRRWIEGLGLRFDLRFNRTGGGDQEFFDRLQAGGGRIVTAGSAVVDDWIPASRARLAWLLRRQFRKGNTLARIAMLHRRGRLARFVKGVGWIGAGPLRALGALAIGRHPGPSLTRAAFGLGTVAGFIGMAYHEYSDRNLLSERAASLRK